MQTAGNLAEIFERLGSLPPVSILDDEDCAHFRALAVDEGKLLALNRRKALWQADEATMALAASAAVTRRLDVLFGDAAYYLWGAQIIDVEPGIVHPWHCDIETAGEGFVSLWLGISGTNGKTSLHVIEGSHLADAPLQASWPSGASARVDPQAAQLLEHPECPQGAVARIAACRDGEGVFFDGRLWHGTFNSTAAPRRALLLQYGRHDVPVRLPKSYSVYPFELDHENPPMTIPVRGEANPVANLTAVRRPEGGFSMPSAKICARPELTRKPDQAWAAYPYFSAETPIMAKLSCHASLLAPGFMPHTAHEHADEEILIVLSGRAEIFARADRTGALRARDAGPGDIFYYPRGFSHTIVNRPSSDAPLCYVMFRWTTRAGATRSAEAFQIPAAAHLGDKRLMVDRPSSGLEKLHIHSTTLAPGQAFPRHIDRYDATLLVLRGELSVLDQTLGPGGVFLTRAGELHDSRNMGTEPCHYLVFEFHAMVG